MAKTSPFATCERFLGGHGPRRPAEALRRALAQVGEQEVADIYGTGAIIEDFENDIASLLGTEAAIFMPSGTMAQQIALRICCDRAKNERVAMHATSHLELHEKNALRLLHNLQPMLMANGARMMSIEDLESLESPPAVVLWELPQRELGGQLPSWESLERQIAWARDHGAHCHLDGARLWEAAPYYERSHSEIASLFDSTYVSFYKGLGGIAGAVLAGTESLVAESRPWLRRHGGNLISLYPYVLSAKDGLQRHLGHFGAYADRAREIARALSGVEGITVVPAIPPTQMMHLHVELPAEILNSRNQELAMRERVMLFGKARVLDDARSLVELSVGTACAELTNEEVQAFFEGLLQS